MKSNKNRVYWFLKQKNSEKGYDKKSFQNWIFSLKTVDLIQSAVFIDLNIGFYKTNL